MKAFNRGLTIFLVLAIFSCGQQNETSSTQPESKAIKVKTAQASKIGGATELRYSGSIEPFQTIPLSFQNIGTVKNIFVEEGDFVKKGTLLASLDDEDAKNMQKIAQSKYQQAKDAYDRLKTVYEEGSLPEIKWVEMETNLQQAQSSLEMAENNLRKCEMYSPTSGVISKRNVEPGQSAIGGLGAPIELVKIENVFVKISIPENEIGKISEGQTAVFTVAALNGKRFEGKVTAVNPVADMISRTYTTKILVQNPGLELKPGMVCDAIISLSSAGIRLMIPYHAVTADADGKPFVFVVSPDKKKVKKQIITTGTYQDSGIEVTSGLHPGETVVVEGKEKLSDNSLISL